MKMLKKLEKWGRSRIAAAAGSGAGSGTRTVPAEPNGILVIRTDSRLGNLVLMEPLLRSLRVRFPGADIHVLTSHVFAQLLESQGYDIIPVDKKRQIREPLLFLKLIEQLRSQWFDIAIDAAHPHSFSLSGALTTILAGAECTVSTDAGESAGWYTCTVPEPPMDFHESRALHSLGSLWTDWPRWSPPELVPGRRIPRDAVGLHVGASGAKRYPFEFLTDLVARISGRMQVEIYWGNDEEFETARSLGERFPVAVMPRMSIPELVDCISGLRLFITADNGPMHVASALSVPVIALFRVENMERFKPLSPGSRTLFHPEGPPPDRAAKTIMEALGYY